MSTICNVVPQSSNNTIIMKTFNRLHIDQENIGLFGE